MNWEAQLARILIKREEISGVGNVPIYMQEYKCSGIMTLGLALWITHINTWPYTHIWPAALLKTGHGN